MSLIQAVVPQAAKSALEKMMMCCLAESLKTEAYASWTVQPLVKSEDIAAKEFTMLTISSYDFRMFVLLHSTCSAPSMRYAADALKMPQDQLTTARYYDFLGELGNRFCGAFKRDLAYNFPHMGMSTPNRMRGESLKHIKALAFASETHINASANDDAGFYASLYVSFYGTREFRLDNLPKAERQVEVGALEMF